MLPILKTTNANILNFFGTLADNLLSNLPPPSLRFGFPSIRLYYGKFIKLTSYKFKFTFVSEETVSKLLLDLTSKTSKHGATVLAKHISQICNLSIKYSIFLSDCKITKIRPLFRKGSKAASKNYLPISSLPIISKIIVKLIHDQTQSFLDKNKIIYRYQQGF